MADNLTRHYDHEHFVQDVIQFTWELDTPLIILIDEENHVEKGKFSWIHVHYEMIVTTDTEKAR